MSSYVRASQVRQLMRLMAELRTQRSTGRARAQQLLLGLAQIVNARAGSSLTDGNFRAHGACQMTDRIRFGWADASAAKMLASQGSAAHPLVTALLSEVPTARGSSVSVLREQLIADRQWRQTPWFRRGLVAVEPVDSSLMSIVRLEGDANVHAISLYRAVSEPRFDEADLRLVELFHQELLFDLMGFDAQPQLSARERQVLDLLLEGRADKEIAVQLGISRYTVNQYNKAVYSKLGVHSRFELLARWAGTRA